MIAPRTLTSAEASARPGFAAPTLAQYYTEDAVVLPPNLSLARGRAQIRELFRELLEAAGGIVRETTPVHVAADFGYGIGRFTLMVHCPEEGPIRDTGKHVLVYQCRGDGG